MLHTLDRNAWKEQFYNQTIHHV